MVAPDPEKIKATAATATLASISFIFWFAFLQQRKCKTPRDARGVLLNQPTRGGIDGLVLFFSTFERSDGSLDRRVQAPRPGSSLSERGKRSGRRRSTFSCLARLFTDPGLRPSRREIFSAFQPRLAHSRSCVSSSGVQGLVISRLMEIEARKRRSVPPPERLALEVEFHAAEVF
jgi:hypothetical protein